MNERIERLRKLDSYDRDLRFLWGKVERLPRQMAEAEDALAKAQQKREDLRRRARGNDADIHALNLELRSGEERLNKLKTQLNVVKTNAEFRATQDEISKLIEEQGEVETKVLELMETADELKTKARELDEGVKQREQDLAAQKKAVDNELDAARTQADKLKEERDAYAKENLEPDDLAVYERTLETRKDTAVAKVKDQICLACHVRLTPQQYASAMIGEELVRCQSCGRIMVPADE